VSLLLVHSAKVKITSLNIKVYGHGPLGLIFAGVFNCAEKKIIDRGARYVWFGVVLVAI
jgi:hypothetical protein